MTFDDTLTDHEFVDALRETQKECLQQAETAEPDLAVDGLHHSAVSRFLALFTSKGSGRAS